MFRAITLQKEPEFNASVQMLDPAQLPDADVHVQVAYSNEALFYQTRWRIQE